MCRSPIAIIKYLVSLISYVKHSFNPFSFPWWALWNVFGQFKLLGQVLGRPGTIGTIRISISISISYNFKKSLYWIIKWNLIGTNVPSGRWGEMVSVGSLLSIYLVFSLDILKETYPIVSLVVMDFRIYTHTQRANIWAP